MGCFHPSSWYRGFWEWLLLAGGTETSHFDLRDFRSCSTSRGGSGTSPRLQTKPHDGWSTRSTGKDVTARNFLTQTRLFSVWFLKGTCICSYFTSPQMKMQQKVLQGVFPRPGCVFRQPSQVIVVTPRILWPWIRMLSELYPLPHVTPFSPNDLMVLICV